MTKTYLPLIILLCIAFTACQKEKSIDTTTGGSGINGVRINRLVYQYGPSDSAVTELRYDAAGRFIGYLAPNGEPLMGDHIAFTINRNSTGIIQSYTYRDATTAGTVETTYNVVYDAGKRQYAHRLATLTDSLGNAYLDSTVFVYNGTKVETSRYYIKEPSSGLSGELSQSKFAYDGAGNLTALNLLFTDFSSANLLPLVELGFQYDGKINPLPLGVEGVLTDLLFFISPANFSKITVRDLQTPGSPALDFIAATYTYRADNRPETATLSVDGDQVNLFYRYN